MTRPAPISTTGQDKCYSRRTGEKLSRARSKYISLRYVAYRQQRHTYKIAPDSSMIIEVTNSDNDVVGEFGYVAQDTANQRVTVPRSCTTLAWTTKIVVTNFSRHKFLRLRRGERVAYFTKADRTSVDIYATNLENLGTTKKCIC